MTLRRLPLAVLAVLAIVALAGGPAGASDTCNGIEYPPPSGGTVSVFPATGVAAHHKATLEYLPSGGGDIVPGSGRFEIDGPAGHETVAAHDDRTAAWTPAAVGHYVITGHWTQYLCADASGQTFAQGTAGPQGFDAVAEQAPTVDFKTSRRAKQPNSPGDASMIAFVNCPGRPTANNDALTLTVYYGSHAPTHASPHLRVRLPKGCYDNSDVRPRTHTARNVYVTAMRDRLQATVTAPGRLRVLMEVTSGGRLIGRATARFTPVKTGERVKKTESS